MKGDTEDKPLHHTPLRGGGLVSPPPLFTLINEFLLERAESGRSNYREALCLLSKLAGYDLKKDPRNAEYAIDPLLSPSDGLLDLFYKRCVQMGNTGKCRLACIKAWFAYLEIKGYIKESPIHKRKYRTPRGVRPTTNPSENIPEGDIIKLLASPNPKHAAVFALGFYGGLRAAEIEALAPGDVVVGDKRAPGGVWVKGKGGAVKFQPLPPHVVTQLKTLTPTKEGKLIGIKYSALRALYVRRCEALGLPRYTPHDARNSFCNKLLSTEGMSPAALMNAMRHSSAVTALSKYNRYHNTGFSHPGLGINWGEEEGESRVSPLGLPPSDVKCVEATSDE